MTFPSFLKDHGNWPGETKGMLLLAPQTVHAKTVRAAKTSSEK